MNLLNEYSQIKEVAIRSPLAGFVDNDKISRPFVLNQNLYIIKENSIIKLN